VAEFIPDQATETTIFDEIPGKNIKKIGQAEHFEM